MNQSRFDVFDCHQHMGSTGDAHGIVVPGSVRGATIVDDEVATRLRFMDEGGIRQALAIPGHNYNRADGIVATRRENDAISAYRDHLPERFPVAAGVVEPLDEGRGPIRNRPYGERARTEGGQLSHRVPRRHDRQPVDDAVSGTNGRTRHGAAPTRLQRGSPRGNLAAGKGRSRAPRSHHHRDRTVLHLRRDAGVLLHRRCRSECRLRDCIMLRHRPHARFGPTIRRRPSRLRKSVLLADSSTGEERAHERRCAAIREDIIATRTLSESDKALVLGGNARRILGLEVGSA